ncbi:hypothetical protein [uncultured Alistipes sp.]|nr:hypothetical protein [uncultured Alistipes sp.]
MKSRKLYRFFAAALAELNPKSWTKESLKNVRQGKKKVCQA